VMLRARDTLVAARTQLINATRGLVKSMGARLPNCSTPSFARQAEDAVPIEIREALLPLASLAAALSDSIAEYDQKIEKLSSEKYGHTALLRQVKGVEPITALAYVLTLENPERFGKSRDVGAYLGLVPQQEDSGDIQPQLGISKAGDTMVRKLLVGSAHYILGPFGRTRTCGDMGSGSANAAERMRRKERQSPWRGSWRCCCTGSMSFQDRAHTGFAWIATTKPMLCRVKSWESCPWFTQTG